jgi:hypothetical protein
MRLVFEKSIFVKVKRISENGKYYRKIADYFIKIVKKGSNTVIRGSCFGGWISEKKSGTLSPLNQTKRDSHGNNR